MNYNSVNFYLYKTKRKNAKLLKKFSIYKLKNENDFINAIITVLENYNIFKNKKIKIDTILSRENIYIINCENKKYYENQKFYIKEEKIIYTIEDVVNFTYDFLTKITDFEIPSKSEIYNNSNIKYFINKYHREAF